VVKVDSGKTVERPSLGGGFDQGLVRMLSMELHERCPRLSQDAGGNLAAVEPAPCPAGGGDGAGQHVLVPCVWVDEPPFDRGLRRAVAHHDGIWAAAHEEGQRLDHHGLAGTGLAGDGGHSRAEFHTHLIDDAEVPDDEFDEHDSAISQCEAGSDDSVEITPTEDDELCVDRGGLAEHRGPGIECGDRGAVDDQQSW